MLKIDIIAVGKLKTGPYHLLAQDLSKRIKWALTLHEIESKYREPAQAQADEQSRMAKLLHDDAFVIVLDERGEGLRSLDFAHTLEKLQNTGIRHLQFMIGGADGLSDEMRNRANLLISFGRQTWPHMMVRVMLLEQIYRAQQILAHHPYHRE